MDKTCLQCNKVFTKKKHDSTNQWNSRQFCSRSCKSKYTGFKVGHKINIGNKNHLGFNHSQKTKDKLRKISLKQFENGMPLETRIKMGNSKKGEKSPSWKGGITPINFKIRNSFEYKLWRTAVFERDNHTCIWCGIKSKKNVKVILHADHIKPFALYPEFRFAIDNGRTLCIDCHKTTDTYAGKTRKNI